MTRAIGRTNPLRVAIADDSKLLFSDDYRFGWKKGFEDAGCEVKVFDISRLRRGPNISSIYSVAGGGIIPKGLAGNIAAWSPDLVWCHHGSAASNGYFLDVLRRKGIHTSVYLCDEPYEIGETASYSPKFDSVFSMDPMTVEIHKNSRDRRNVFYLPPAVDTDLFKYNSYEKRTVPAFFLGNADLIPRREWLEPIERTVAGADIRYFPHRMKKQITKYDKNWISSENHPKYYSNCLVGLNVHRSPWITKQCFNERVLKRSKSKPVPRGLKLCESMPLKEGTGFWNDGNIGAAHVNPRFFEMAACGTLVVSDDSRSELRRMFPMAPAASDPEHFLELVLYYIKNKEEAEAIGRACYSLISRRHTYQHRALEVLIRVGFKESRAVGRGTSWEEPEDWLTPQSLDTLKIKSSSEQIGRLERWSPQFGMSSILRSGNPKDASSIGVNPLW